MNQIPRIPEEPTAAGSDVPAGGPSQAAAAQTPVRPPLPLKEAQFHQLLEVVKDYAIITLNPRGEVTSWNAGAAIIKGYTAEEIVGRHFSVFYPHEDIVAGKPDKGLAKARQLGRFEDEGWRVRKDGSRFWAHVVITASFDPDGHLLGFSKVTGDRTEARRAQEALRENQERFRQMAESVEEVVLLTSMDDHAVLYVSPAARRILGVDPDRMYDTSAALELVHPDDRGLVEDDQAGGWGVQASDEPGGSNAREFRIVRPDGALRWILERSREVERPEGSPRRIVTTLTDVTDQKALVEALRAARTEAERANTAKSDFLSRMSHELRTPLNAILGFGQLLEVDPLADDNQRDSIGQILQAGQHLLSLINEVLDVSQIESGHLSLTLEAVQLADVASEALELTRSLAAGRGVRVLSDLSFRDRGVLADRQRLKQAIVNLLTNAIKYNKPEGQIQVYCEPVAGRRVRLVVSDSGIGIAPENLNRLFLPFERLGGEASGSGGAGLGLVLTRRLVEGMGGAVGAKSQLGVGSSFWLELATVDAQSIPVVPPVAPGAGNGQARSGTSRVILYIEDNSSNMHLVERILGRRPDVTLFTAMRGNLGLDLAQELQPSLVLLDLNLGDLDGEEVLRRLKANAGTSSIPVVIVSADATQQSVDRLVELGAADYLTKPFELSRLMAVIDTIGVPSDAPGAAAPPATAEEVPVPPVPDRVVLDPHYLQPLFALDDDGHTVRALVSTFLGDVPKQVAALLAAAGSRDADGTRAAAHRLAGSVGVFGAMQLVGLLRGVESAALDGAIPDEFALTELQAGLAEVVAAVAALGSSSGGTC